MVRTLLVGLVAVVIAIVVISALIKVALFGLVLVAVAGVTFLVFRSGRRPGGRFRR